MNTHGDHGACDVISNTRLLMIGDSLCSRLQVCRIAGLVAYISTHGRGADLMYYGIWATGQVCLPGPPDPSECLDVTVSSKTPPRRICLSR